ncbi:TldD/PmbA family protein [Candidatus Woesearchaeota archaeon]|nr:TldD/PmbA family protein [Candidatus Woesearchaeota archaeon]
MTFLKLALANGASYAELMSTEACRNNLEVNDKEVKEISSGDLKTFSARVLYKGAWGLAYSCTENYAELVAHAIRNAKSMSQNIKIDALPVFSKKFKTAYKINPADISLEEKKESLLKLNNLSKGFKKIASLKLIYSDGSTIRKFENTEGSSLEWSDVYTAFMAWAFAKDSNSREDFLKIKRIRGGYELMKDAASATEEVMEKAEKLLKAEYAKGGHFPIIVDQKLAGVFAHEAVGHACEADLVLSDSSILHGKIGQKIGKDNITIIDDGTTKNWGWTPFDSEGVKAQKTVLVRKGILEGFLHTRESATIFKTEPTGNGRAETLANKVIPRMTNTVIEEGDSTFEEMLAEIKKGYYLKGSAGGQVDPTSGEFLFNAQEGYLIENGELKKYAKGVSLTGNILQTLHNIFLVAKDTDYGTGYCGKAGQLVPVSEASPHIMIKDAKVGGK